MDMETQYLVVDSMMCWQRVCAHGRRRGMDAGGAAWEQRGGAGWTQEGSEPHDHSVNENGIHEKLNTI
jgi:hypothetical protein